MTWVVAGYLAVGILFTLIVRPLTPVAWVAQIALWPLALLMLCVVMWEIVLPALLLVPLVLLLFWYWG